MWLVQASGYPLVIITSRSPEDWLGGPERRFRLCLGGLAGEERWEYCTAVLRDLGKKINRQDEDLAGLMNLLGGHPLAMRVILPRLEKQMAGQVAAGLKSNLAGLGDRGDEAERKLFATLQFVEESLPEELRELLVPLGMHEGYVAADYLERMAKSAGGDWNRPRIDELAEALEVADQLTPRPLHEQRSGFHVHGASFHYALGEAERLGMGTHFAALTQSLAAYAQNTRKFAEAGRLFEALAEQRSKTNDAKTEAAAYHQLGMIAQEHALPGILRPRSSGIANRWRLPKSRATSTVPPSPMANWGVTPKSNAILRRRSSGTANRWRLPKSRATSRAPPSPITTWG